MSKVDMSMNNNTMSSNNHNELAIYSKNDKH